MTSRKQVQAVFFSVIMVVSMLAMGAGGVAAQSPASDDPTIEGDLDGLDVTEESIDEETTPVSDVESEFELEQEETHTDPQLEDASGETVLLLSVDRNLDRGSYFTTDADTLQADSEATLQPVADEVTQLGAEVRGQFWVGNIVSVNADLDTHDVEDFASIDGVQAVALNTEAVHPAPPETNPAVGVDQDGEVTYGLDQIDVPGFEEEFGVSGDGATVSIIDDGVSDPEAGHPDLEFAVEAIAANGEVTTGTLGSPGAHGEHVAGTATGAAEPEGDVPRYGVAPDADLIKINAFEGGAATEDLIASVQFSADEGADVASMSLGFAPQDGNSVIQTVMESAIQDANAAGTMVIGSAGNEGSGDAGGPTTSPGAEFSGFSVGASNDAGNIAAFSSGDLINERQIAVLDGDYPDTYPSEFVKPDVAAPGADVLSAGPLGEDGALYSVASGTSMAAPHVAGSVALVQSATEEDLHPKLIESALVETAEKDDNEFTERNNRDIRFGAGIINVTAATQAIEDGNLEIDGEVTDSEGEPIVGATVATEDGALTTTNETGEYTLQTTADSAAVTADEFGFVAQTETVNEDAEVNFELDDELDVRLFEDQPVLEEIGAEFSVSADVANLENLTVELTEETDAAAEDVTLMLDGEEVELGEPVAPAEATGTVTLSITVEDADEGDLIGLEHTFAGGGDSITATTGPTELVEELEPPEFELSNFVSTTDSQPVGEPVEYAVQVDVTNVGQETGMVELAWFNGPFSLAGDNPVIELEPGETATETLNFGEVLLYEEPQTVSHGFDAIDVATDTVDDTAERPFVVGEPVDVGVVDDRDNQVRGDAVASTLENELPTFFDVEVIGSDEFDDQDVAVVQHLASGDPAGLLEETEDRDVGAVYLDQWASSSNAIPRRSALIDDPADTFRDDDSAGGSVFYEIGADHPIFDGVGDAGDSVEIIADSEFADHTFFEGTDADVLAEVSLGDEPAGDAFAVDEEDNVVLASSLGYTEFIGDEEFTSDADAILANAVQHTVPEDRPTITVEDEFAGVVADDDEITVTIEDSDAADLEPGDRITLTVDGEPVTVTEVDDDVVTTTFDPTTLDLPAEVTAEVDIEEIDDLDTDTIDTVDEAVSLDEGGNFLSVPQGANLSLSADVTDAFVWDSSEQTFEGVDETTFDSADELNDGLYFEADSDDARVGYSFLDEFSTPVSADIDEGWNLLGSNFDTSSQSSQALDDDLGGVAPERVVDGAQERSLNQGSSISEFDAYWAFVDEDDERPIITPTYERADREAVLDVGESNFEVVIDNVETTSIEEAEGNVQLDDRNVVGASEQVVIVDAFVQNTGDQFDVQFADLEVTRIEPTVEFEQVDRTGVELGPGDGELVTLTYVADQDDTPNQIPFPLPDDLAIQVLTDDDTASSGVAFDGGGITAADQALTSDDEFIVDNVDFAGEGIVELRADDGTTLDSQTVDTINDEVRFDDFDPASVTDTVDVVIVDPDSGEDLTSEDASVLDTRIEVTNNAPSFALVNETVEVPATVTNNARDTETDEITFEVIDINGEEIEFNESQDVTLDPGVSQVVFDADTEALGAEVGDEITHAVSSSEDTSERTLTIAEATLEFNDQSVGTSGGEPAVLVEDVTADTDQQIVITDTDLEVVGSVTVDERINDADVPVPLDTVAPADHIAHVVADDTDVPDDGPGLVNAEATITAADVTIDPIDDVTVESAEVPTDVVEEVTIDATVLDVVDDRNEDFTVEIRESGSVIGESENLTDTADDVTIELDDPITAEEDAVITLDAVLVDQDGDEFQATAGAGFQTVQDSTTFEIEVVPSDANVELPDQAVGAADGSDAVFAEAVTGSAGQFVAITAADELDEILGATELDEDVAGEEIIVELDEEINAGEYRVHLTSDVGLIGDDDEIITDDGTVFEADLDFEDQSFTGATDEVTASTADLLDGMANDTEFVIDLHPTDENDTIIGDEAIGQSDNLTGANEDVTIELDEEITEEDDFVAMLHFGPSDEPLTTPPITQVADDAIVPVVDQATVTIDDPAAVFEVSDIEPEDATVTEGDEFDVSATIDNTGEEAGTQEIELRLEPDGDAVATQNVTLETGESDTVLFEDVSVDEPGEYNHTIASDDDAVTGSLTVEALPFFEVSDLEPEDAEVVEGDEFNVSATITNTGDLEGTQDIELRLFEDGDAVATQSVTLAGGAGETVTFEDVSVDDPGEYEHTVASDDDAAVGSLTVLSSESNFVVDNLDPEDAQVPEGADPIDVTADVENLGTIEDTQTIELTVTDDDGTVVFDDSQELTLADGALETVTFEDVPAGTLEIGEYTHEVASANDSAAGSLSVIEGVEIIADLPDETAPVGDSITADLAVDVPDDQPDRQVGSFVVDISYDDTVVAFEDATSEEFDLTVNPGDNGELVVLGTELDGVETPIPETVSIDFEVIDEGTTTLEFDEGASSFTDQNSNDLLTQYEAGSITGEDPDGPSFAVENLDPAEAEVPEGADPINVSADLENVGNEAGTQAVALEVLDDSDEVVFSETTEVTLDPAENETVTFEDVPAGTLGPGAYTHQVVSEDDMAAGDLTVVANEANFDVSDLDPAEAEVPEGADPINVSATVENIGNADGTQDVELTVEDDTGTVVFDETQEVSLDAGETTTVTFEDVPAGTLEAGDYTHVIASEDSAVSGSLTVLDVDEDDILVSLSSEDAAVGETAEFDLEAEGIDGEVDISSYDFTIEYDDDVLNFTDAEGVDFGSPFANADNGTLSMNALVATSEETPLTLATVEFEVLNDGSTDLTFVPDESGANDEDGNEFDVEYSDGSFNSTAAVTTAVQGGLASA